MKKIKNIKDISSLRSKLKGKKIGLAHGVFDIFHFGHLLHLQKAKSYCDVLVVSITGDKFINKGPGRPLYNTKQRLNMLASIEFVDFVILSDEKTSKNIIRQLRPHIYVKGNDYHKENKDYTGGIKIEKNELEKFGGKIVYTNEKTLSSTNLINRFSNELSDQTKEYLLKLRKKFNFENIKKLIDKSSSVKTLVIGEIIKDEYVFCLPLGMSPKEQIISMQENKKEIYAGGIVASVNHLSKFLDNCSLLSVIPEGENTQFINKYIYKNINKILFKDKNYKLITKTRYLDESNNKLFQISNKKKNDIKKATETKIVNYLKKNLKNFDHIIVNDFGHGLVTEKIINIIEKNSKYLSINVQTNSSNIGFNYLTKFTKTNYFTIDEPEARLALSDEYSNTKNLFYKLKKRIKFQSGSITFGKNGSYTIYKNKIIFSSALTTSPVDTLGAGDAFFVISSIISRVSNDPEKIGFLGNIAGAFAVHYLGHKKYLNKEILLNYVKTYLNI